MQKSLPRNLREFARCGNVSLARHSIKALGNGSFCGQKRVSPGTTTFGVFAGLRKQLRSPVRLALNDCAGNGLVLVDFVLRSARQDLLFSPGGDGTERVAADEFLKGRFVGPFTGDQIRRIITDILPER